MVSSILYFRTILLGVSFVVWTDHRSLTYWLKRQPVNERHARWMVKLQDMIFEIKYVEGDKNILADLLSRPGDITKSTLPELHEVLISHAVIREDLDDEIRRAQTPEFIESCGIKEEDLVIKDELYYITRDGASCYCHRNFAKIS